MLSTKHTKTFRVVATAIALSAMPALADSSEGRSLETLASLRANPPVELPTPADRISIGRRRIYPPIHKARLPHELAVIHPMSNMYQYDQAYADLMADNGSSQICGASAMANAMVYLKFNHRPAFPNILQQSTTSTSPLTDYVRTMFDLCRTDRNNGTYVSDMRNCAASALEQGSYNTANTFIRGIHSNLSNQRRAPTTSDLRAMAHSSYQDGQSVTTSDRAVVLLFGWYKLQLKTFPPRWEYKRTGGHYVTLAGYNLRNSNVFYVSNPLVNYGSGSPVSRITLEQIPSSPFLRTPGGFKGLVQTRDLVGGNLAVLEDMVITLPWE